MFDSIYKELLPLIDEWTDNLNSLTEKQISIPRNSQNRNIRQIVGHMIDSASNNTHRVVHLQYNKLPLEFPNYATDGNNDRWIAIQNYEQEDWNNMVQLWTSLHIHYLHVIQHIDINKLGNEWLADKNEKISLQDMVEDFPRHFNLHISEIKELLK